MRQEDKPQEEASNPPTLEGEPEKEGEPQEEASNPPTLEGEPEKEGEQSKIKKNERARDHHFQGSVNVLFGTGWYFVAPYDKDDPDKRCGEWEDPTAVEKSGPAICTGRSAWHLDFLGGFGLVPGLEVFAMFRLGITAPTEFASNPRQVGVGVKVYTPDDGLFKIGFGVAPLFDFSDRYGDLGYDFVIHVPILAQFDFVPWFGAYLQVAPNISFVTEFKFDITAGLGVQGRFP